MRRLHIIGRKNHGKTNLIVDLIAEASKRGIRPGAIKHTHHQHELDTPGKDSYRHREAGAELVGVLSHSLSAVFWPARDLPKKDRYAQLEAVFANCDLVLVEGDSETDAPKIEVWRAQLGSPPLAVGDSRVLAVVTDDAVEVPQPVLSRSDVPGLLQWILTDLNSK